MTLYQLRYDMIFLEMEGILSQATGLPEILPNIEPEDMERRRNNIIHLLHCSNELLNKLKEVEGEGVNEEYKNDKRISIYNDIQEKCNEYYNRLSNINIKISKDVMVEQTIAFKEELNRLQSEQDVVETHRIFDFSYNIRNNVDTLEEVKLKDLSVLKKELLELQASAPSECTGSSNNENGHLDDELSHPSTSHSSPPPLQQQQEDCITISREEMEYNNKQLELNRQSVIKERQLQLQETELRYEHQQRKEHNRQLKERRKELTDKYNSSNNKNNNNNSYSISWLKQQDQLQAFSDMEYTSRGTIFRELKKHLNKITECTGMEFVFIPNDEYTVGKSKCIPLSHFPINSSNDSTPMLDRRTQWWLCSEASKMFGDGAHIVDGPSHFVTYCEEQNVDLPPFFISRYPVTVEQCKKLMNMEEYKQLQKLITPEVINYSYKNYCPNFICGHQFGFTEEEKDNTNYTEDCCVSPFLQLPYWTAVDFCTAMGGRISEWDEWEAACRGIESYVYPWGDGVDETKMEIDECPWSVTVHDGTRVVNGISHRVRSWGDYCKIGSPFGVQGICKCGVEWNSCSIIPCIPNDDSSTSSSPTVPLVSVFKPKTHILRSISDHSTQTWINDSKHAPLHHRTFVGTSLACFSLPNRAVKHAAFRLVFSLPLPGSSELCRTRTVPRPLHTTVSFNVVIGLFGKRLEALLGTAEGADESDRWCTAVEELRPQRLNTNNCTELFYFSRGIQVTTSSPSNRPVVTEITLWSRTSDDLLPDEWDRYSGGLGFGDEELYLSPKLNQNDVCAKWGMVTPLQGRLHYKRSWARLWMGEHFPKQYSVDFFLRPEGTVLKVTLSWLPEA